MAGTALHQVSCQHHSKATVPAIRRFCYSLANLEKFLIFRILQLLQGSLLLNLALCTRSRVGLLLHAVVLLLELSVRWPLRRDLRVGRRIDQLIFGPYLKLFLSLGSERLIRWFCGRFPYIVFLEGRETARALAMVPIHTNLRSGHLALNTKWFPDSNKDKGLIFRMAQINLILVFIIYREWESQI